MSSLFLDRSAFHLACFCFYREICLPPIETFLLAVACLPAYLTAQYQSITHHYQRLATFPLRLAG
jgi:hypothetical protein